ncbi:hypothetical protein D5018_12840 [Parashewanella curva]|uniref:Uncharacterized protein n=1 Tax=Parashewanella curva TaxID=2338552 RepID=A0A3L8PVD7_9GAMM|nr:hypothetical protein [Parashewanella curva]RLV59296.1 hypothetical protein D5018_12840 [Parashewanella curva]
MATGITIQDNIDPYESEDNPNFTTPAPQRDESVHILHIQLRATSTQECILLAGSNTYHADIQILREHEPHLNVKQFIEQNAPGKILNQFSFELLEKEEGMVCSFDVNLKSYSPQRCNLVTNNNTYKAVITIIHVNRKPADLPAPSLFEKTAPPCQITAPQNTKRPSHPITPQTPSAPHQCSAENPALYGASKASTAPSQAVKQFLEGATQVPSKTAYAIFERYWEQIADEITRLSTNQCVSVKKQCFARFKYTEMQKNLLDDFLSKNNKSRFSRLLLQAIKAKIQTEQDVFNKLLMTLNSCKIPALIDFAEKMVKDVYSPSLR